MKPFYTVLLFLFFTGTLKAQVILNEIYPIPGNNRHEFFELYNMSGSNSPVSVDDYTLVTYFEEGNKKGFYVLDLPNQSVGPRGYYVGSAAIPFNFQGITNCTNSNFSWNDAAFLSANNGYLKKWVAGNTNNTDGNSNYDLEAIPADFNDLFNKTGGNGATYNVFLYNGGNLVNAFFGGTGGNTNVPAFISAMPQLSVDMMGSAPDFTINFKRYNNTNSPIEYTISDVGTDNGYIRIRDGVCGAWEKSSAGVQHSPGTTNGGQVGTTGSVSVETAILRGTALSGSRVKYNVVAAPITALPVTLMVYIDNGITPGQLDSSDTFIESNVETTVGDVGFVTTFFPYNQNVLIVVNTAQECIDKVLFIPNVGVLPVKLISFEGTKKDGKAALSWKVEGNEMTKNFEVQKSIDGKNFTNTGLLPATEQSGKEHYLFNETAEGKTFYRLKINGKDNAVQFSKVISINEGNEKEQGSLQVLGSTTNTLTLSYKAVAGSGSNISIYDITGHRIYTQHLECRKDMNMITVPASLKNNGIYVAEIVNNFERVTTKFLKQ